MTPIEPQMTVGAIFDRYPNAMRVFIAHRMACIGCAIAPYHTIEEACAEYGLPPKFFIRELAAESDRG